MLCSCLLSSFNALSRDSSTLRAVTSPGGVIVCLFPEGGQRAAEFCRSYVMPGGKQRTLFTLQRVHLYIAFDLI